MDYFIEKYFVDHSKVFLVCAFDHSLKLLTFFSIILQVNFNDQLLAHS